MANDTSYGLTSYVFTNDTARTIRVAHDIEAGEVHVRIRARALAVSLTKPQVNEFGLIEMNVSFGGWKQSGQGREMGVEGVMAYTRTKAIHINLGVKI